MISTFKIRNFRSILDMTVDFRFAEGKAPNGYREWDTLPFVEVPKGDRIVPCLALFGANASGKTNVIRALNTFRDAVLGKTISCFEPNKLHENQEITSFEIVLYWDDNKIEYLLDYNGEEIRKEKLLVNGKLLYEIANLKGVFSKEIIKGIYKKDRLQSILDVECSDGAERQVFTFLSRVGKNYQGLNEYLIYAYLYINSKIIVFDYNKIPLPVAVDNLQALYKKEGVEALHEISDLVRKLDIDINSIDMKKRKVGELSDSPSSIYYKKHPDDDNYVVADFYSYHKSVSGQLVRFDFVREESEGTVRLAGLVGLILFALKCGHVLVVDELDCSLHPLLLRELIRLFKDKRYNTEGAQLIFTTHNTDILDDSILRVSEVAIIRKTLLSGSMIRRIVDFKDDGMDVRNVTNFRKQYLDGFYSGVPHPAI